MERKRSPTIEAAKRRNNRVLWLNHVKILDEDVEWLSQVERLTLWNVKLPLGLLARLDKLWWLDLGGGSAIDLEVAKGANKLQYLAVNQVRGMCDLSAIAEMTMLRYLVLYGLAKVTHLPSFSALTKLEHVSVGQMISLISLQGILEAPSLREFQLLKKVNVNEDDVEGIIKHPSIKQFSWFAEDVPNKVWAPVVEKIKLPPVPFRSLEDWFSLPEFISPGKA